MELRSLERQKKYVCQAVKQTVQSTSRKQIEEIIANKEVKY